jgi:hypothetical protein
MTDTNTRLRVTPSATPNEADIREWADLPRDEQLRRLREALDHPDCATVVDDTMNDIAAKARARADARARG